MVEMRHQGIFLIGRSGTLDKVTKQDFHPLDVEEEMHQVLHKQNEHAEERSWIQSMQHRHSGF